MPSGLAGQWNHPKDGFITAAGGVVTALLSLLIIVLCVKKPSPKKGRIVSKGSYVRRISDASIEAGEYEAHQTKAENGKQLLNEPLPVQSPMASPSSCFERMSIASNSASLCDHAAPGTSQITQAEDIQSSQSSPSAPTSLVPSPNATSRLSSRRSSESSQADHDYECVNESMKRILEEKQNQSFILAETLGGYSSVKTTDGGNGTANAKESNETEISELPYAELNEIKEAMNGSSTLQRNGTLRLPPPALPDESRQSNPGCCSSENTDVCTATEGACASTNITSEKASVFSGQPRLSTSTMVDSPLDDDPYLEPSESGPANCLYSVSMRQSVGTTSEKQSTDPGADEDIHIAPEVPEKTRASLYLDAELSSSTVSTDSGLKSGSSSCHETEHRYSRPILPKLRIKGLGDKSYLESPGQQSDCHLISVNGGSEEESEDPYATPAVPTKTPDSLNLDDVPDIEPVISSREDPYSSILKESGQIGQLKLQTPSSAHPSEPDSGVEDQYEHPRDCLVDVELS